MQGVKVLLALPLLCLWGFFGLSILAFTALSWYAAGHFLAQLFS